MKYQHRVMGMLSLLAVITYVDRVSIAVAGPRMQDELSISPEAWGWVASVFFISYGAFEIPTGLLGDRIGPRGYTEAALVLSSLPYVVGAVANGSGGLLSDALVRRWGLKAGRRGVGVLGSAAPLCSWRRRW